MNIHKNARTTPQSRAMLIHRVRIEGWPVAEVAMSFGVSKRTVWLARHREEGAAGLQDRSLAARRHPQPWRRPGWRWCACCGKPNWWQRRLRSGRRRRDRRSAQCWRASA